MEALGLLGTGMLLARRDDRYRLTAAVTATLLLADAWFDVTTAAPGRDQLIAITMAACPELPVILLCATLALRDGRVPVPAATSCAGFHVALAHRDGDLGSAIDAVTDELARTDESTPELLDYAVSSDADDDSAVFELTVGAGDDMEALAAAVSWVRPAIHAAGGTTPGWILDGVGGNSPAAASTCLTASAGGGQAAQGGTGDGRIGGGPERRQ
jgi:hypothetical protein